MISPRCRIDLRLTEKVKDALEFKTRHEQSSRCGRSMEMDFIGVCATTETRCGCYDICTKPQQLFRETVHSQDGFMNPHGSCSVCSLRVNSGKYISTKGVNEISGTTML